MCAVHANVFNDKSIAERFDHPDAGMARYVVTDATRGGLEE